MSALHKLNKDELIKIILNVKKNLTEDELEIELKNRKNVRKLNILKRSLLNLTAIPHFKSLIEKYEEFIKNSTDMMDICKSDFGEESKQFKLFENEKSLHEDIQNFRMTNGYCWIDNDSILYSSCHMCEYRQIRFMKDNRPSSTYTSWGTSPLCPDHFNPGY